MKCFGIMCILAGLLSSSPAIASRALCLPGVRDYLRQAHVVVEVIPVRGTLTKHGNLYYLRGEYRLAKSYRGNTGRRIITETTCVDGHFQPRVPTQQNMGYYCKDAVGARIAGFKFDSQTKRFAPQNGPLMLFLSKSQKSAQDGIAAHRDVTMNKIDTCVDMGGLPSSLIKLRQQIDKYKSQHHP